MTQCGLVYREGVHDAQSLAHVSRSHLRHSLSLHFPTLSPSAMAMPSMMQYQRLNINCLSHGEAISCVSSGEYLQVNIWRSRTSTRGVPSIRRVQPSLRYCLAPRVLWIVWFGTFEVICQGSVQHPPLVIVHTPRTAAENVVVHECVRLFWYGYHMLPEMIQTIQTILFPAGRKPDHLSLSTHFEYLLVTKTP